MTADAIAGACAGGVLLPLLPSSAGAAGAASADPVPDASVGKFCSCSALVGSPGNVLLQHATVAAGRLRV